MNTKMIFAKIICSFILSWIFLPDIIAQSKEQDSAEVKNPKETGRTLYGVASFYAEKFHGKRTANGEIFSRDRFTAACNVLPLGTWIQVANLKNGKIVVVKTNDRLHANNKRLVDLSHAAATKLGFINAGLTKVKVTVLDQKLYNKGKQKKKKKDKKGNNIPVINF